MEEPNESIGRLGVMGGTFDPIHMGHLVAASEALHEFHLDRVMFMPTGQPWQKDYYSDAEDRFLMTMLGASNDSRFVVSRLEIDRVGPTYTLETLQSLKDFHGPGVELFFIIGADAVLKLDTWHHIEGLAEVTDIIAVNRPGFDLSGFKTHPGLPKIHEMNMPAIDISSSDVRARVQAGRPIDYLVPRDVLRYIKDHGLYVGPGRFDA